MSLPCTIHSNQTTSNSCMSTIAWHQASTFLCTFIPHNNMCIWFESSYWSNCFSWRLQNRSPEAEHILIALPLLDFPHFPVSSDFHFISIFYWEPFFTVYFIFHISYRMSLRTNYKLGFSFHLWFTAKEQIILVFFQKCWQISFHK